MAKSLNDPAETVNKRAPVVGIKKRNPLKTSQNTQLVDTESLVRKTQEQLFKEAQNEFSQLMWVLQQGCISENKQESVE